MSQDIRTIRIATQGPAGPPGGGSGFAPQVFTVASQAAMLALAAHQGDIAVRSDTDKSFALATADPTQLANWTELLAASGAGAVTSVAGRTGAVTLAAADISGLAASATTDTTNAGNIASGTLNNARLSGVALAANNLSDLANAGTARTNLGLAALAVLGVGSGLTSGGGNLSANITSVAGRTGAVTLAAGDVSGLAASATTDATNAANIASGTLPDARHSSNIARRDQANAFGDNAISRFSAVVSVQTANYTLQASDNGTVIYLNSASALTVTLPNSLAPGFNCVVVQEGAGQVTFSAASGATKQSPSGNSKTSGQYGSVSLLVKANAGGSAADWRLDGALSA
jgi:hypothetical protein